MLSCQAGCPPSRGGERPGLRLSVRNFLAFRDARRTGFSASLTLDVMLFMLAALGFAVLTDVDAYGGNILQPLGIHGGNPRQGGAHWKHHGYGRQAILEAGVPRTHLRDAVVEADFTFVDTVQGRFDEGLVRGALMLSSRMV